MPTGNSTCDAAVVVTVTVAVAAEVLFKEMVLGDTKQVDIEGAPAQVSVTFPLNPPPAVKDME